MRIFIDTADLDQIREAYSWGIVDGITTNPSLIKKAVDTQKKKGKATTINDHIKAILEIARRTPVSLEVIGATEEEMTRQGRLLYETFNPIARNVVVKIPVNPTMDGTGSSDYDGLKSIKTLAAEGIPVNTTLIFTPEQALLAAKAGAAYVSPFAGRIDDDLRSRRGMKYDKLDYFPVNGLRDEGDNILVEDNGVVSGVDLVEQIVRIFANYDVECEVLAASIRNPRQAREVALAGAHVSTIPFEVLKGMLSHHKTREGMKAFTDDIIPEYAALLQG